MTRVLYAEFTAVPGAESRVADLVGELADRVRAEPGNLAFEPHTFESEPRHWFVYEVYRDEAAFQAHIDADYGAVFNSELTELIEERGSQLTWLTPR
ncbi:MAG TPA: putative quinol monooxygenase [Pseudolysinimonas sp.]|nr:putative quinol monooxygenase [Pseudolysinimonas sp.]